MHTDTKAYICTHTHTHTHTYTHIYIRTLAHVHKSTQARAHFKPQVRVNRIYPDARADRYIIFFQLNFINLGNVDDIMQIVTVRMLTTEEYVCGEQLRFGVEWGGVYNVCASPSAMPTPRACLVYSFG